MSTEGILSAARSWLFVPGDRPERFDTAVASGADAVVLDLEDAVSATSKEAARDAVSSWLGKADGRRNGVVRVNAVGTEQHDTDVAALAGRAGLLAVMVPMADSVTALDEVARRTGAPVVALIETADAVLRARELAQAHGVIRLALGTIDLCLDIDAVEDDRTLLLARSMLVLASRAAGVAAPIDGVTTDLSSAEAAGTDAATARRLGFGGKLCIHPRQVEAVAQAFAPTEADIAWARRVLAALDDASATATRGAVAVDGELVDKPVAERARRILARIPTSTESA